MTGARRQTRRILVGAGSFADAAAALRIAERLATDLSADLGGVLIEEVNTLAICEIPNQRIVLIGGATMLAPNRSQVRTFMQADARAFEQSLVLAARTTGATWAFARETGDLVGTALRAAVDWDILVIGYRRVHAIPGKIVLLRADDALIDDMETMARVLAHQLSADQVVFSVATGDRRPARTRSEKHGEFGTLQDAMAALARTNAQAVFVDLAHGPVRSPDDLARLLDVSRCPLIVFGASKLDAMLAHSTQTAAAPKEEDPTDEH